VTIFLLGASPSRQTLTPFPLRSQGHGTHAVCGSRCLPTGLTWGGDLSRHLYMGASGLRRSAGGGPLYLQAARAIEKMALDADLMDETPLPPEWSLVERFRISRGTLRRAIAELERSGMVWRVPGRGTFVNPAARLRRVVWERLARVARPDSRFNLDFSRFIPDFEGSDSCAEAIRELPEYQEAVTLFVTPDNNLERFRVRALRDGKRLVVATYAMSRGFVVVEPASVPARQREVAALLDGMDRFGRPLTLADLRELGRIDLVVSGAAAVSREGVHFGKGHGYLDLEWGLLTELALANNKTPVVVSVHACQVVHETVPHAPYDVTVDVIVTPKEILRCVPPLPKPQGIFWDRVPFELLQESVYFAPLAEEATAS
jgi:5-formyltetrahydrofolate cyclo-ligase